MALTLWPPFVSPCINGENLFVMTAFLNCREWMNLSACIECHIL
ncbi:hypothetical protein GDO81_000209 [Engystomops pustulosus]|uniref:Uncharacterized protein n=1 Tax=Engystomops pustulosus TaxID=76066 RepID=A0AAV7D485_ENGPU|nr:hypothetical protein GDO81_000209 [Engystomops pustulosus]